MFLGFGTEDLGLCLPGLSHGCSSTRGSASSATRVAPNTSSTAVRSVAPFSSYYAKVSAWNSRRKIPRKVRAPATFVSSKADHLSLHVRPGHPACAGPVFSCPTITQHGSERGPVVLPVFKIGRSPLTRGGWVRLPGASASLRPLASACELRPAS